MIVTPCKTKKIVVGDNIYTIFDKDLPHLSEKDIIIVSAKIVAICEENVIKNDGKVDKETLIRQEAERYIKDEKYYKEKKTMLTVKNHIFTPSSGIDLSNGNGYYIFWPKDVMKSARDIWNYLRQKHTIKDLGVILTDSYFVPLRRGAVGVGIAWCGFIPIENYIGTPDVFNEKLQYSKASLIDGLSAAAEVVMGEGNQQTPLAIIRDVPFVTFVERTPTKEEIAEMKIVLEDDYFAPLLTAVEWEKGEGS